MLQNTPITLIILIVTAFVSWRAMQDSGLFERMLHNPYRVKHQKQYYRMVSHLLIHADFMHLALNMFVFYSFGQIMELYFRITMGAGKGTVVFLLLYVLGGIVATLPSMRKHADNYGYNAVGASGAVSAVLMSYMILFPTNQIAFFFIPMPAFMGVLVFFLLEQLMMRSGKTNIAHDAHMWGALFGIVFILVIEPAALSNFIVQVRNYF